MAVESEIEPSRYYYKVFTHLWNPPLLEEIRLVVVSEAPMTSDEVRAALVRSGRAVAGHAWIKQIGAGEYEVPVSYETPEDYIVIGILPPTAEGVMPARPTGRDPTFDYPFEMRP